MKSIQILISTSALLVFTICPIAHLSAQGQGQSVRPEGDDVPRQQAGQQAGQQTDQQQGQDDNRGYGRENPYERYTPYERPYEPRPYKRPVVTSDHMLGLDLGGPPTAAGANGGNFPAANNRPRNNGGGAGAAPGGGFGGGGFGGGGFGGGGGGGGFGGGGGGFGGGGGNFRGNQPASTSGNAGGFSSNSGPRVSVVNGVRTIEVEESSRKIKIVEDPQQGIYIEITKQYGPKELASLKNRMPELGEYIDLFPQQLNNSDIELSIGVTSKFTAANAEDLERQDQGAYNIYRRFTRAQSNGGQTNNAQQSEWRPPSSRAYFGQPLNRPSNLPSFGVGGGGGAR
ncbi:MAG: hypothetical protein MK108_06200 [Mariniblastus sp.]|nr:hypothetical protein [Mariniblastus sp.]